MTTKTRIRSAVLAVLAIAIIVPVVAYGRDSAGPRTERRVEALVSLGTGFTFQGRLTDAGVPANGVYDLNFYLYDALAGGSQVGPVQTAGDVAVSAGLFTVTLNFGDIFHGAQYFLDIQVRPGASTGAYTILSPREPIGAVPNASYALTAGGLDLPLNSASSANGPLLQIRNTSTGASAVGLVGETASTGGSATGVLGHALGTGAGAAAGVRGINDSTGSPSPGVLGQTAGSGYGVQGVSPSGFGVFGTSSSGTGVFASTSTGTALEVAGPIKVSGVTPAAFVHIATISNISGTDTILSTTDTGINPNAILIVTPLLGVANPYPIGVYWDLSNWRIKNTAGPGMVAGARFNVLVINR